MFLMAEESSLFVPTVNYFELIARGVMVYFFLLFILRITGKRQIGQLAPFDLVLLLVLSNAVQNAMNGGDNSLTAGVISATTLIVCNGIVSRLTAKSKWLEGLIEGRPRVLVHDGVIDQTAMTREQITHHELMAALRNAGCGHLADVHFAVLENSGHITVVQRRDRPHPVGADSLPLE
jgi:uncharacterized membrane protein YcaP (DUF421 family)